MFSKSPAANLLYLGIGLNNLCGKVVSCLELAVVIKLKNGHGWVCLNLPHPRLLLQICHVCERVKLFMSPSLVLLSHPGIINRCGVVYKTQILKPNKLWPDIRGMILWRWWYDLSFSHASSLIKWHQMFSVSGSGMKLEVVGIDIVQVTRKLTLSVLRPEKN